MIRIVKTVGPLVVAGVFLYWSFTADDALESSTMFLIANIWLISYWFEIIRNDAE